MTKTALDHKGSKPLYPVYGMGILWNMSARDATIAALSFGVVSEIPLDGDSLARSANRNMLTAREWRRVQGGRLEALQNNHTEINRPNR